MRSPCSPRTWPCSRNRKGARGPAGSATLMALFLFFIFSVLGLSLAYLLQLSLRISAAKGKGIILGYASEAGLKIGWGQLVASLAERDFPRVITEDEEAAVRAGLASGGHEMLEEALGETPSLSVSGCWQDQSWEASTSFALERYKDEGGYVRASFKATTIARGKMPGKRGRHRSSSESSLELAVGLAPLADFPLLVSDPETGETAREYAGKHHLSFLPGPRGVDVPLPSLAQTGLLPQDASPALSQALQIKLFKPGDLTMRALRKALRLEPSDDPVPDGVYLIRTDLGLGGVFVQGDLDELILAIDEDSQVLFFRNAAGTWTLTYRPEPPFTKFAGPAGTTAWTLAPAGMVCVNGKVHSLGGGRADGSGGYVMSPEMEVPCVLRGVILTIVSSDTLTLTSHLIRQGVSWQKGIPYLKDVDAKLTLYSTGLDFLTGSPTEGGVVIGRDAPRDLKVEASLVAPGRGFLVEGDPKVVRVVGGIEASSIDEGSSELVLAVDPAVLRGADDAPGAPTTSEPVIWVKSLRLRTWRDRP